MTSTKSRQTSDATITVDRSNCKKLEEGDVKDPYYLLENPERFATCKTEVWVH
jgi:hypothetical protein